MNVANGDRSIGERVAYYRRRRGLTQVTLAGLVGRTESWLEKVEHGRAPLDRISVLRELARVLDVPLRDLLPDDADARSAASTSSVPTLRELVLSYRAVNPRFALLDQDIEPLRVPELRAAVGDAWRAYQDSRFGYAVMRLNQLLPQAYVGTRGTETVAASRCLAQLYHLAASVLVKLGDLDLARLCADRGDIAAQEAGDAITRCSLQRAIAHTLFSNGQYADAVSVVREGILDADSLATRSEPTGLSVLGTLMLVGATASAHAGDRREALAFLGHAGRVADRLGGDRNHAWTAFGPTNVAIHEVTVAAELDDPRRAADVGARLDVTGVPRERRTRHKLEVARAFSRIGRRDDAIRTVLLAEPSAPDQVRRHFITRSLVGDWLSATRLRPSADLLAFARRVGHAA